MLFNILQGLTKTAATKDIRYYLNAVHVKSNEYGMVTMEATDGTSGIRIKGESWNENNYGDEILVDENVDILLCRKSLSSILKMFNSKSKMVLKVTNDGVTLNGVSVETIYGNYPDLGRIIDRENNHASDDVGVNAMLLSKLTSNLNLCLDKPKYPTLRIKVQDNGEAIKFKGDIFLKDEKKLEVDAVLMPVRL